MKLKIVLAAISIFIITYFTFSNAFKNHFVSWDDMEYVLENTFVLEKNYAALKKEIVSLNYHPVTMWSLASNSTEELQDIANENEDIAAKTFIQTNVIIHSLNAILVFILVFLLLNQYWVALFTALIFALHPMRTESVVWVSERKDVLYVFFTLIALIAWIFYTNYKVKSWKWYVIALLAFVIASLSKATAVIIPVLFIIIEIFYNKKNWWNKGIIEKIPFFVFSFIIGFIAIKIQSGSDLNGILHTSNPYIKAISAEKTFSIFEKISVAAYGFSMYSIKLFYPVNLSPLNIYPSQKDLFSLHFIASLILFFGSIFILFYAFAKQKKILFFGISWYIISLILLLQIISVGIAIYADRYSYLAHIGLLMMIIYFLYNFIIEKTKNEYVFIVLMSLWCVGLIALTRSQNEIWYNTESLWNKAISIDNQNIEAYINRGNFIGKRNNIEGALNDFKKARDLGSKNAKLYEGMGNCFGMLASKNPAFIDSALQMFNTSIELNPNAFNAVFNRALTNLNSKRFDAAIKDYERAIEINPAKKDVCSGAIALCYFNLKNYEKAYEYVNESIALGNTSIQNYLIRADILSLQQKTNLAITDYEKALQINPQMQNVRDIIQQLKSRK